MSECLYCGQKNPKKLNGYCIKYSCENRRKQDIESQQQYKQTGFDLDKIHEQNLKYNKKFQNK